MTDVAAPSPSSSSDKLDAKVLKVAGVVVLGAIMSILDVTVVNVAMPTFQQVFDAPYATVAWTMTAYTLALATVIPITGWAADRFGTKRLYMGALTMFVLGSVLCAFAWDITSLVGFRVLQGFGGGMLMPLGMTIMTRAAGPARIGRVMAVLGIPMLLGPIFGPILGGWLIENYSWHWIFLINLPIGVVALIYAALVLPKDRPTPSETFDWVGMLLLSPGLALFLFGISSIPEEGTIAATKVLVPGIIGLLLVIGFVFHAFRPEHPLIDLRLFKNRNLTISVIAMFLFIMAFMGAGFLLPTFFMQIKGETVLAAGVLMAPQGIGAMITMPIAGTLVDKMGAGKIVLTGLVFVTAGMAVFTQVSADMSTSVIIAALFVMGLGMGATMMPVMTAALQTLREETYARGSTLMNITQQIGSSVGVAVISVVLTNQMLSNQLAGVAIASRTNPQIAASTPAPVLQEGFNQAASAFAVSFTVSLILVALTFIPAFFIPRRRLERSTEETHVPVAVH